MTNTTGHVLKDIFQIPYSRSCSQGVAVVGYCLGPCSLLGVAGTQSLADVAYISPQFRTSLEDHAILSVPVDSSGSLLCYRITFHLSFQFYFLLLLRYNFPIEHYALNFQFTSFNDLLCFLETLLYFIVCTSMHMWMSSLRPEDNLRPCHLSASPLYEAVSHWTDIHRVHYAC